MDQVKIKELHFFKQNKRITQYELTCFIRWIAYACQNDGPFLVSDYDVINLNLKPSNISMHSNIHFMHWVCPCLVSGTPKQFEEFCIDIIETPHEKTSFNFDCYHDQYFIREYFLQLRDKYLFDKCPTLWNKVKHYCHSVAYEIKNTESIEELRVKLIENDMEILDGVKHNTKGV